MSPLLPCNPERLFELISPWTNRAWIDEIRWLEVMQKPELLEKYADWFREENHSDLRKRLRQMFMENRWAGEEAAG
jgi:hypothetical protein